MHHVLDAVRRHGEDGGSDQRRTGRAGQVPGQHEHRDAGSDKARQEEHVVDEDRRDVHPQERRRKESLEERRVGVRERVLRGVENIRVEQVERRCDQRVRNPGDSPDTEIRIVMAEDRRAHMKGLRPRDENGQADGKESRAERRERRTHHAAGVRSRQNASRSSIVCSTGIFGVHPSSSRIRAGFPCTIGESLGR